MAVYRFKFSFEDYDDVVRIMEVKASQTFGELQQAFHHTIGFDTTKTASFYMSDDYWKKGKEITSRVLSEEEAAGIRPIKSARLSEFIADPHQKIYYLYDNDAQWGFHIELVKIAAIENGAVYPRCVKSTNEAPKQYGTTVLGAVPEPEDFDEDAVELIADEEELPEGTEVTGDGESEPDVVAAVDDELETADEDILDDEGSESEDFR